MFPRLRDRLGTALDLVVEFSTLGEYTTAAPGAAVHTSATPAVSAHDGPALGGAGVRAGGAPGRRIVAAATPAARRLQNRRERQAACQAARTDRCTQGGAPPPVQQPCLATG
jgi:hypothetical protein